METALRPVLAWSLAQRVSSRETFPALDFCGAGLVAFALVVEAGGPLAWSPYRLVWSFSFPPYQLISLVAAIVAMRLFSLRRL